MRVFLQSVVEDKVIADGAQAQVQHGGTQVGQHQQAEDLAQGAVLGPRCRVHVRRENIVVGNVQHKIHGWIWSRIGNSQTLRKDTK